MQEQLRDELFHLETHVDFAASGPAPELPSVPGLCIDGIGNVALPLEAGFDLAQRVIRLCNPVELGSSTGAAKAKSKSKIWQIDASKFHFRNPAWDSNFPKVVDKVRTALGCRGAVKCVISRLLIFEPGAHGVFQRDVQKKEGVFATLLVQLPSSHSGGHLVIKFHDERHDFALGDSDESSFGVFFAAYYLEAEHAVQAISSGLKVMVAYDVCWQGAGPTPSLSGDHKVRAVAALLAQWPADSHRKMVLCLEELVAESELARGVEALCGTDRARADVLVKASAMLPPEKQLKFYVTNVKHLQRYSGYRPRLHVPGQWSFFGYDDSYSDDDMSDEDAELTWELESEENNMSAWVSADQQPFQAGDHLKIRFETEALNQPWDASCCEDEFEDLDDEGHTKTVCYQRTVLVFFQARHELDLVLQEGGLVAGAAILQSLDAKCRPRDAPPPAAQQAFDDFYAELLSRIHSPHDAAALPVIATVLASANDLPKAQRLLSDCISRLGLCSSSIAAAIVTLGTHFTWPALYPLLPQVFRSLKGLEPFVMAAIDVLVAMAQAYRPDPSKTEEENLKGFRILFSSLLPHLKSTNIWPQIKRAADLAVQLKDVQIARGILSNCIASVGLFSDAVTTTVVTFIETFGWPALEDLIVPLFVTLVEKHVGSGINIFICVTKSFPGLTGKEKDDTLASLQAMCASLVPLLSASNTHHVQRLAAAIASIRDLKSARLLLSSYLSRFGFGAGNSSNSCTCGHHYHHYHHQQSPATSSIPSAIAEVTQAFGWASVRDLLPPVFKKISGMEVAATTLLTKMLVEDHVEGGATLLDIITKALNHFSANSFLSTAKQLCEAIVTLRDTAFTRAVLAALAKVPLTAIIADAVVILGRGAGWAAVADIVPSYLLTLQEFSVAACSLVATVLQEYRPLGLQCATRLVVLAHNEAAKKPFPLPANVVCDVITGVLTPLGPSPAYDQFVARIVSNAPPAVMDEVRAAALQKIDRATLLASPLAPILLQRMTEISAKLAVTSAPPSWKLPNRSVLGAHYDAIASFLRSPEQQTRIFGFRNINHARQLIKAVRTHLPVAMAEGGTGSRAFVAFTKSAAVQLEMERLETHTKLTAEWAQLSTVFPSGALPSAQLPIIAGALPPSAAAPLRTGSSAAVSSTKKSPATPTAAAAAAMGGGAGAKPAAGTPRSGQKNAADPAAASPAGKRTKP